MRSAVRTGFDVSFGDGAPSSMPGSRSLSIGGVGTTGTPEVVSPPFCINQTNPHFRFLVKHNECLRHLCGCSVKVLK